MSVEPCEHRDINDLFDEIILAEEHCSHQSFQEGFKEGCTQGNAEGYKLGYGQGARLGQEFGSIYGWLVAQQQLYHTDKVKRTLQQLREAIDVFPCQNDPDMDIVGAVEHIRSLYKRVRTLLGEKTLACTKNGLTEEKDLSF